MMHLIFGLQFWQKETYIMSSNEDNFFKEYMKLRAKSIGPGVPSH